MVSPRLILIVAAFTGSPLAVSQEAEVEDLGFIVFRDRCTPCHLQTGLGIKEMGAPSIAGLPRWYVADQLRKFRRDERGFSSDDATGNLMQTNAYALDEKSIAFVGRYIESLAKSESRDSLGLPIEERGRALYAESCGACHGANAEGVRSKRAPPLTSQQDWYLLGQMEKFASGARIHYFGSGGPLIPEDDLAAIIAWISQIDENQ